MVGLVNLGMSFGARSLFEGVNLKLVPGQRYGLVGANGSGKTTLLRILASDETPTEGTVTLPPSARVGVLRQDRFLDDKTPILDVAMQGDALVWEALCELDQTIARGEPDPTRQAELQDRIAAHEGYTLEARASAILEGLGIPVAQHRRPLGTLSGGFRLRVLLAQVLLGGPDVLLLDEPNNHLDILSIRWLEKFLIAYRGCAVVISHDQRFLDNVTTHILDCDYGTISLYTGNYSSYASEKLSSRARLEAEIARAEAIVADKRAWVERFGAKATKARQAQSRLKQIEKIEVAVLPKSSRRTPSFAFVPHRPSGRDVLSLDAISKSYGETRVLRGVSLTLRRGERAAVIGPNGLGKSTLLKIVTGALEADSGTVTWGHEVRVGYFAQDHREVLVDADATALEVIATAAPKEGPAYVRGQLGRVLFSAGDVDKTVGALSGGEAARLVFCRIMTEQPNVLILDEPTNHLDMEAIAALIQALANFEGTVLFVSHDRAFVSALATRVLEVHEGGIRDFPGTYDEYLASSGDDHLDETSVILRARQVRTGQVGGSGGQDTLPQAQDSRDAQRRRSNRQKKLPELVATVLAQIEKAETRQREIHALWCSDSFYAAQGPAEIAALEAEEVALRRTIADLERQWEQLEAEAADPG